MYAVIQVGSYQYKVSPGTKIETELLDVEKGKAFPVEKVLVFAQDNDVRIGQPVLKDVQVTAQVINHIKDDKKVSYKYRLRKDSAWKKGHRQNLTVLNIKSIEAK